MYKYAQVIIQFATLPEIDRFFTYEIPEAFRPHIRVGQRVKVPFGNHNAPQVGYVAFLLEEIEELGYTTKPLMGLVDEAPIINSKQWEIIHFMVMYYGTSFAAAIDAVLPPGLNAKPFSLEEEETYVALTPDTKEVTLYTLQNQHKKTFEKQRLLLNYLKEKGPIRQRDLKTQEEVSLSSLKTLEQKGLIRVFKAPLSFRPDPIAEEKFKILNSEQSAAKERLVQKIRAGEYGVFLLKGVTGSGKTEVFLYAIREVIESGGQVIVMVPEIALTKQTLERFQERFGNQVALTHSRMTPKERQRLYAKVARGEVTIVIGPRSAIFMPFTHLKMVVIDEAHEASYKSEMNPKYHAIDVALKRMQSEEGVVLLATATPSLESYYKVQIGEYEELVLKSRVGEATLPEVQMVDMRLELREGNNQAISRALHQGILETLERGHQVMLLINRRGHSTFINCRNCGYVIKCHHCDVSMTYHRSRQQLECHYCGHKEKIPETCPGCGSSHIKFFGSGTEKIEEYLEKYFHAYGIGRMDLDTTGGKDGHTVILEAFRKREINLLVGTQMIAKGHDFPAVGLVGIVSADMSLYMQDFRSNERTFQLLTQAMGRAGRSHIKGKVIIQSYNPEHSVLEAIRLNAGEAFYKEELANRKLLEYPPYGHIFTVMVTGKSEKEVIRSISLLGNYYRHYAQRAKTDFRIIGPSVATIGKLVDEYRWRIIIVSDNREKLLVYGRYCLTRFEEQEKIKTVKMQWDIDPLTML
ncbi:replication restart helicase PriA [Sporanaerobium hydrogeniformans]|uniref:replication restart helicase PriA n=1 Tax=Sporanaerobium hydrogeniformans TaxID=3072179 RepID=UPI0015D4EAED|nr:primosomal protein N' [Sporanaerobium hydrogeniformans]